MATSDNVALLVNRIKDVQKVFLLASTMARRDYSAGGAKNHACPEKNPGQAVCSIRL